MMSWRLEMLSAKRRTSSSFSASRARACISATSMPIGENAGRAGAARTSRSSRPRAASRRSRIAHSRGRRGGHSRSGSRPDPLPPANPSTAYAPAGRRRSPARQRNVEEEADAVAQTAQPELARQRHQLIVMDPDDVARPHHRRQLIGEARVDAHIRRPGTAANARPGPAGNAATARACCCNSRCSRHRTPPP